MDIKYFDSCEIRFGGNDQRRCAIAEKHGERSGFGREVEIARLNLCQTNCDAVSDAGVNQSTRELHRVERVAASSANVETGNLAQTGALLHGGCAAGNETIGRHRSEDQIVNLFGVDICV